MSTQLNADKDGDSRMKEKFQILIVDDEQQMLLGMEAVLARLGHTVVKCFNGSEALEVLAETQIDLVISDMKMPVMTSTVLMV